MVLTFVVTNRIRHNEGQNHGSLWGGLEVAGETEDGVDYSADNTANSTDDDIFDDPEVVESILEDVTLLESTMHFTGEIDNASSSPKTSMLQGGASCGTFDHRGSTHHVWVDRAHRQDARCDVGRGLVRAERHFGSCWLCAPGCCGRCDDR